MKVKIKKLHPDAVIPKYAKHGDAGLDLVATEVTMLEIGEFKGYFEYRTGLSIEIPEGYVGLIFPRSSISKTAYFLANSVGVIDSGFRGEITCRFKLDNNAIMTDESKEKGDNLFEGYEPIFYDEGDKVAQLIIVPYPQIEFEEVDELTSSERGTGGYGSTDSTNHG